MGFGGYPSFPALCCAKIFRLPCILHEQNAVLAVCNDCGTAEELSTTLFSKIISSIKTKSKFNLNNFNLEITTTCKECN